MEERANFIAAVSPVGEHLLTGEINAGKQFKSSVGIVNQDMNLGVLAAA